MPKTLSKADESKLLSAIEKTAELVNAGEHPNAAIAKAAEAGGIPPGHINVMVHAYNTGRTTRQRQSSSDPLEKAADFELADAAQVLERLYPTTVKTAAARHQETVISTQYALPPTGILSRRAQREKQATVVDWTMCEPPPPLPRDARTAMQKAACHVDRGRRAVDEARRQVAANMDKMAATFNELTSYFRRPDATPLPTVREQAFLLHGDKATQLLDQLVAVTPGLLKFSHNRIAGQHPLCSADGEAFALVSQFLDELDAYKQARADYTKLAADTAADAEVVLRPFFDRPRSVLDDTPIPFSTKPQTKSAAGPFAGGAVGGLTQNVLSGMAAQLKPPDANSAVNSQLASLTDPHHEARLRNIRTRATLQDLLLNDPIISGHDPQEVISAFNQISEVAPRAVDQRMLMQALLRKHLTQGATDPFDADQLLGMESKMQKRDAGIYGEGAGDGSVVG